MSLVSTVRKIVATLFFAHLGLHLRKKNPVCLILRNWFFRLDDLVSKYRAGLIDQFPNRYFASTRANSGYEQLDDESRRSVSHFIAGSEQHQYLCLGSRYGP